MVDNFQRAVRRWVIDCFGLEASSYRKERTFRFLEEALELAQSCAASHEEVQALVEYVFSRPVGEFTSELGGTMTTLAALADAYDTSAVGAGWIELAKNRKRIAQIREKWLAKTIKTGSLP